MKNIRMIILLSVITLLVLFSVVWVTYTSNNKTLATPSATLDAYLTEVQKRPYSYENAISYVDITTLEDEFLLALMQESKDFNSTTYNSFNIITETIYHTSDKASIKVELIYDQSYTPNVEYDLIKVNDDWKVDLQSVQEEYFVLQE